MLKIKRNAWIGLLVLLSVTFSRGQVVYENKCNDQLYKNGTWFVPSDAWIPWKEGIEVVDNVLRIGCNKAVFARDGDLEAEMSFDGVEIDGYLRILPSIGKVVLTTRYVLVQGRLDIGTIADGMGSSKLDFVLDNGDLDNEPMNLSVDISKLSEDKTKRYDPSDPKPSGKFGDQAFVVLGGQVNFFGVPDAEVKTNLAFLKTTIHEGEMPSWITLDGRYEWEAGDEIVLASTSQKPGQTEKLWVKSVEHGEGWTKLELTKPVKYPHTGQDRVFEVKDYQVSMAAEVVRLTRKIVIRGSMARATDSYGGHFIIVHTALKQVVRGVRFFNMGQRTHMGRYPFHQHLSGPDANTILQACTIDMSHHRGVVIHGTHNMKVLDNVLFNINGHAMLIGEDGAEMRNVVTGNTIITVHAIVPDDLVENGTDDLASGLWLSNPLNYVKGNRVVGSEHAGVWFEMRNFVAGLSDKVKAWKWVRPDVMHMGFFLDNVVHSNAGHGLRFYPDKWVPIGDVNNAVDGVLAYMNGGRGIFLRNGYKIEIKNAILVDNGKGAIDFNQQIQSSLTDALIVGRSEVAKDIYKHECPRQPAVMFRNRVRLMSKTGAYLENVVFTGFNECSDRSPAVAVDGTLKDRLMEPFTSGTQIRNCEFLDTSVWKSYSLKRATDSKAYFSKFYALHLLGSRHPADDRFIADAFLIAKNSFMKPRGVPCQSAQRGLICPGTCYRTMSISLSSVDTSKKYSLSIYRSDGQKVRVRPFYYKFTKQYQFWFTLRTREFYVMRLNLPEGERPTELEIMMGDKERQCKQGAIRFSIVQDGFEIKPQAQMGSNAKLMTDRCDSVPVDRVGFFQQCQRSFNLASFVIRHGALSGADMPERILKTKLGWTAPECPSPTECRGMVPFPDNLS